MRTLRTYGFLPATLLIVSVGALACFFDAAPSECIQAAQDAGLPDSVIEQLRNPGDLNAVERAALNRILSEAGIDDVCEVAADATGAADTPKPTQSDASSSRVSSEQDGAEDARTSDTPVPQATAAERSARIPKDDEHRRRCRFWALNNLEPVVYGEFSKLDPDSMDDLDRILWSTKLQRGNLGYYDYDLAGSDEIPLLVPRDPGIYCRDYWAEPLNRSNADLRNHEFELKCRDRLEKSIRSRYSHLADAVNYQEDNALVYQTPNQHVRVLQWLDISGDELLNSDNPPYRILQEQSRHYYAHYHSSIPTEDDLEDYKEETGSRLNMEWLGILAAAGMTSNSSKITECHYFYPQVFYGYWVPMDPQWISGGNRDDKIELPKYESSTMPLYLLKTVTNERVEVGYPLGFADERYYICGYNSSEESGYFYVEHPAGDYCEKIP